MDDPKDQRVFDWLKVMPDASCYPTLVDLLLNGSLIDRYIGLVVDGGRNKAALPDPNGRYDSTDPNKSVPIEGQVTRDEVALWRLLHELEEGIYDSIRICNGPVRRR
jgi:hypothetical protein